VLSFANRKILPSIVGYDALVGCDGYSRHSTKAFYSVTLGEKFSIFVKNTSFSDETIVWLSYLRKAFYLTIFSGKIFIFWNRGYVFLEENDYNYSSVNMHTCTKMESI
jgi:hypothetical protein